MCPRSCTNLHKSSSRSSSPPPCFPSFQHVSIPLCTTLHTTTADGSLASVRIPFGANDWPREEEMDVHGARLISIINSTGFSPFLFFNRNVSSLLERWCIFNFSSATLIIVNVRAARFDWGEQENKEGGLSDRRRQISSGCGAKSRQTVVPTILSTLLSIRPSNSSRPRFDSLIIGNRSPTAR